MSLSSRCLELSALLWASEAEALNLFYLLSWWNNIFILKSPLWCSRRRIFFLIRCACVQVIGEASRGAAARADWSRIDRTSLRDYVHWSDRRGLWFQSTAVWCCVLWFQGPKEPCSANQWRRRTSGPSRSRSYGESTGHGCVQYRHTYTWASAGRCRWSVHPSQFPDQHSDVHRKPINIRATSPLSAGNECERHNMRERTEDKQGEDLSQVRGWRGKRGRRTDTRRTG